MSGPYDLDTLSRLPVAELEVIRKTASAAKRVADCRERGHPPDALRPVAGINGAPFSISCEWCLRSWAVAGEGTSPPNGDDVSAFTDAMRRAEANPGQFINVREGDHG
jgi:hypothetical protein